MHGRGARVYPRRAFDTRATMELQCQHLRVKRDDTVLWVTIDRPDCRNALSWHTWSELRQVAEWAHG